MLQNKVMQNLIHPAEIIPVSEVYYPWQGMIITRLGEICSQSDRRLLLVQAMRLRLRRALLGVFPLRTLMDRLYPFRSVRVLSETLSSQAFLESVACDSRKIQRKLDSTTQFAPVQN